MEAISKVYLHGNSVLDLLVIYCIAFFCNMHALDISINDRCIPCRHGTVTCMLVPERFGPAWASLALLGSCPHPTCRFRAP